MKVAAEPEAEADAAVDGELGAFSDADATDGDGATETVDAPVDEREEASGVELHAATTMADVITPSQFLRAMSDLLRVPPRPGYDRNVVPAVVPQLVANDGAKALRQAIADPDRFACEPKVDGVRGFVVYQPGGVLEMRNRRGEKRDWLRGDAFEAGLRRLADRLPNLWEGTVLDGELTAGRFEGTMSALLGSKRFRPSLRFVVFNIP